MNVYDFDKTIYEYDSTLKFYKFCLSKRPVIILCLPKQIFAAVLYLINIYSKTKFKEKFYCFLKYVPNIDLLVDKFWENEEKNINDWYLKQKRETDVIVSASPQFLLEKMVTKLNISDVIASKVDKNTGKYDGENCYGDEKVIRFFEKYPNEPIERFYSDSYSDKPMADLAEKAYIVYKNKVCSWGEAEEQKGDNNKDLLQIFRYGFWGGIVTLVNLALFYIFSERGMHYLLANIVSYYIAVVINFFINFYLVFEKKQKSIFGVLKKLWNFLELRTVSLLADTLIFFVLITGLGFHKYISRVCLSCVIILINFFWSRRKIFV